MFLFAAGRQRCWESDLVEWEWVGFSLRESTTVSLFKHIQVEDGEDLRASLCPEELSGYIVGFRTQSWSKVSVPPFSQAKSQSNKFLSILLNQICHSDSCCHLGGFSNVFQLLLSALGGDWKTHSMVYRCSILPTFLSSICLHLGQVAGSHHAAVVLCTWFGC